MEKVRPQCGQPSDRGRLKIRSDQPAHFSLSLSLSSWHTLLEHSHIQCSREAAFFHVQEGPMFSCLRSTSVTLSHVQLGLPGGRFQSDGGLHIAAATARLICSKNSSSPVHFSLHQTHAQPGLFAVLLPVPVIRGQCNMRQRKCSYRAYGFIDIFSIFIYRCFFYILSQFVRLCCANC